MLQTGQELAQQEGGKNEHVSKHICMQHRLYNERFSHQFLIFLSQVDKRTQRSEEAMNGRPVRLEACDARRRPNLRSYLFTSSPIPIPIRTIAIRTRSVTGSITQRRPPSRSSPQMLLNGECTFLFLFLRFKSDVGSKGGRREGGIIPRSGWRDAV